MASESKTLFVKTPTPKHKNPFMYKKETRTKRNTNRERKKKNNNNPVFTEARRKKKKKLPGPNHRPPFSSHDVSKWWFCKTSYSIACNLVFLFQRKGERKKREDRMYKLDACRMKVKA